MIKMAGTETNHYEYRGARSLVLLHEKTIQGFTAAWKEAKTLNIKLPETKDPAYRSLDALISHILKCACRYLNWCCKSLNLPDPETPDVPSLEEMEERLDPFLKDLFVRWRSTFKDIPEEKFYKPEHLSWWNVQYCVDAMLEHAVVHPMRHELQLRELIAASGEKPNSR